MKKFLLSACSSLTLTTVIGFVSTADAQSMDYGSLESLYGEAITTSATGTPQKASEIATNMTILTADQIRQSGSRSLPEILSRVPGLDIAQSSSTSFDVGVRGYQQQMNPRLLVLIDGRQVFQDDYSRTIWENLPVNIDNIRQIEVVIGAASALFGSNAAGGVINIITYSALYDQKNVVSITGGTQKNREVDATGTAPIGDFGAIKLSAGAMNQNEFDTPRFNSLNVIGQPSSGGAVSNSEWAVNENPMHRYAAATGDFRLGPDIVAETGASYTKSASDQGYYNGKIDGVLNQVTSTNAGFTWQSPIGTIKNTDYWNHSRTLNFETGTVSPFYGDTEDLVVAQLEDQFRIGANNTFRLSTEYKNIGFHVENQQTYTQQTAIHENNFAVGGMWLWQITDDLSWTNAGRFDDVGLSESGPIWVDSPIQASAYDHSLSAESANSGLVYKASSDDTVRLTFGRAVQFPRLLDYGFNIDYFNPSLKRGFERVGNPALKPTTVTNYELDYERKLAPLYSTLKTSISYEVNHAFSVPFVSLPQVPTALFGKNTAISQSEQAGQSDGIASEVQLIGSLPSGLRWDISYSYASVTDSPGLALDRQDVYHDSTPKHHGRAILGYSVDKWEFDLDAQILSSFTDRRGALGSYTTINGYSSLGGRIGYSFLDNYTLSVSGTNISQAVTEVSGFPKIDRQVFATLTGKF